VHFNKVGISQSLRPGGFGQLLALRRFQYRIGVENKKDSLASLRWFAQQILSLAIVSRICRIRANPFRCSGYRLLPADLVICGQVMAQLVIRGQDILKSWGEADRSGAENKALAVAKFCFNWPNYLETDKKKKK
jgi:hypothetical protein